MWPTLTVLVLATTCFLLRRRRNGKSISIPPGYMGMPLFGEIFSFLRPQLSTELGEFMAHRISRFGKIFSINLMGTRTIVSADPELTQFIYRNELRFFKTILPPAKLIGESLANLASSDDKKITRPITVSFFSGENLRTNFIADINQFASLVIDSWKDDVVFSAEEEATRFALYIILKKTLSMAHDDPEIEQLRRGYETFSRGFVSLPVDFPGTTYWKALKSRECLHGIIMKTIGERLENKKDENKTIQRDDFLEMLMTKADYSAEIISDFLLVVILAGHDSSIRAITASIYFLHGCPRAIEQLREEHLRIRNSMEQREERTLSWDDYMAMEFTKCVIKETLRLTNNVSITQRRVVKDIEFKGYIIPKGDNVILHHKAVHLDPSIYEDPGQFNPWRWQGSSNRKLVNNFMAFGCGVKSCPGAELARLELAVFLHHLILKYDWNIMVPDHPLNMPLARFPKGLPIKVRASSTK